MEKFFKKVEGNITDYIAIDEGFYIANPNSPDQKSYPCIWITFGLFNNYTTGNLLAESGIKFYTEITEQEFIEAKGNIKNIIDLFKVKDNRAYKSNASRSASSGL